ncbi:non-hydrolyzing UDP-N-acetylglucosamine 2-epimerase [Aminirod propionatiphilus]|uniref:non-hydrolyzing UDP-N-acetylglucosamine 2-epimerase n=1 Tax=Aminirod propionatiphilus TaxID=3415223 RepID=UPI003BFA749E
MTEKRVVLAFGTRPEAIKMAPVYRAMTEAEGLVPLVLLSGQHREQLLQAMELFGLEADRNLEVMTERQSLPELAARILPQAASALREMEARYVLVHGDTLTTFVVAWAAFLEGIPVGHVEAGLRSHRLAEPFPEEANRRLTSVITDLDFPPTEGARRNLLDEGKSPDRLVVTGQTAVDAIRFAAGRGELPVLPRGRQVVSVTLHRRENWPRLGALAGALADVARAFPDHLFVYPVHLNPVVREAVVPVLSEVPNFILLDPLEYGQMAALLSASRLIVTDSGGLQEEGASLGVPVAVLRNVTERPEGLLTGILRLVGTDPDGVRSQLSLLLDRGIRPGEIPVASNPYGDGRAGERIARAVAWRLGCGPRPADWVYAAGEEVLS